MSFLLHDLGGFLGRFRYQRINDTTDMEGVELKEPFQQAYSADSLDPVDSSRAYNDQADMKRLGKKQEFKRNFRFLATLGFATIFTSTWEFILVATSSGLINGGFGGLIWEFVWTFCGMSTVVLSLAEMASIAPTAGGQYHVSATTSRSS